MGLLSVLQLTAPRGGGPGGAAGLSAGPSSQGAQPLAPALEQAEKHGAQGKSGPDAGGPARPIQARSIRLRIRAPQSYDELRVQVEARFATEVMSRTTVAQPDGGTAPIHRERELVAQSNLRQLHATMQPGEAYELTGRLVPGPGGHSYQELVFSLPQGSVVRPPIPPPRPPGIRGIAPPNYVPPHPPRNRDDAWRQAQRILEETVGQAVGGGADVMWTPTSTGISKMMPAVPGPAGFGPGGDAVPRQFGQTNPRWAVMPPLLNDTAKILAVMLQKRFNLDRVGGAVDLDPAAVRSVVVDFVAEARAAKATRNDRLHRLDAAASVLGGQSMFADDLRCYSRAESQLFQGDPTCMWRYVT
jgi:hypothetical protein